jgi:uncharacterized membrane protein YbhN (UPF0104 family)
MRNVRHILGHLFGLAVFCMAIYVLHRALRQHDLNDVLEHLKGIQVHRLILALAVTVVSYLVLTLYDTMALRHSKIKLAYHRIILGSYVGYVFSHNATIFAGVAARYRVYSHWGITALQTAEVVAFCGLTFWLGFFGIGGVLFLIEPLPTPEFLHLPFASLRLLGAIFLVLVLAYVVCSFVRTRPIKILKWQLSVPTPRYALGQLVLSTVDWCLVAAVLYILLDTPGAHLSYARLLGAFLLAQSAGMASNVPGGLGVFETIVLLVVAPPLSVPSALGSLLVFRVMYFLLPLLVAVVLLGLFEISQRKKGLIRLLRGVWRRNT